MTPPLPSPRPSPPIGARLKQAASLVRQLPRTFRLVWEADARGTVLIALLTLLAALFPAAIAWVGKLIVDAVVEAAATQDPDARQQVLWWVGVELGLMFGSMVVTRLLSLMRELMRARLGNLINLRILRKALELELKHFEDSETYDKMQNARREASARPLSLVFESFHIVQSAVTLASFAAILVRVSPWAVLVLVVASLPSFLVEAKLSNDSFRLWSWRAPEGRRLNYLEWILTRDSHVKEVKLFDLGELILGRYQQLFSKFYAEDRRLALRRLGWGVLLGGLSLLAFYGAYAYLAGRAGAAAITLGDMVLYVAVFRQGQAAFQAILTSVGALYEGALFMSNLFGYLEIPTEGERARLSPPREAPQGGPHALELRGVSFRYPGRAAPALDNVHLVLKPGEKLALVGENGAGKSTLVKLLLRLYQPTEGEILYGGVDLRDMDAQALRQRIGAVYQDFVRYQFSAAENIGLGDVRQLDNRPRIELAAERGGAASVIAALPNRLDTVLGGWFEKGQELSSGQWQKLAVSRAFMREAEILILDEPTAAIDAEAEHELFQRFQALAADRTAIIISHRFSTVRMADRIAVLHEGKVVELGSHDELVALGGRYAHLFRLQAQGYLS